MDGFGNGTGIGSENGSTGTGTGGIAFTELPLGFGMALAMNEPAMRGYAEMTETEREHVILKCKDARSREEMQKIVDSLVPNADPTSLYEHHEDTMF